MVFVCQDDGALAVLDLFAELGGPPRCAAGALLAGGPSAAAGVSEAAKEDPSQHDFWSTRALALRRSKGPPEQHLVTSSGVALEGSIRGRLGADLSILGS